VGARAAPNGIHINAQNAQYLIKRPITG